MNQRPWFKSFEAKSHEHLPSCVEWLWDWAKVAKTKVTSMRVYLCFICVLCVYVLVNLHNLTQTHKYIHSARCYLQK
jgi:hypothetical protein